MKQVQAGTGWCHQFMTIPWGSCRNAVGQHQNQRDKGAGLQWCWGPARTGLEGPRRSHRSVTLKDCENQEYPEQRLEQIWQQCVAGGQTSHPNEHRNLPSHKDNLSVGPCSFQARGWSTTHLGTATEHKEHHPRQAHTPLVVKQKHSCFPLSAVFG